MPYDEQRLEAIRSAFRSALQAGQRCGIEQVLRQHPAAHHAGLLAELLRVELELWPQRASAQGLADYAARFPDLMDVVRQVCGRMDPASSGGANMTKLDSTMVMEKAIPRPSILAECGIFRAIPSDLLEPAFVEQEFAAGEYLMRQGEAGKSLLVISEGSVEISTEDVAGNSHVIDQAQRGQVLGEMALLADGPRSASARAVTKVRARVLPSEKFYDLAHQYPQISVALSRLVADRLGKPSRDALTDKVLDRFQIVRRLGRGGMGVVYEARDTTNGEQVALKMMSHRFVHDAEALRGFQQEADIIESFVHPNIVKMLGRFAAFHTYFIVLEFCPGRSLAEVLLDEGPLDEPRFRRIAGQVAAALRYAHQANVVHRDIKPANVMLSDANGAKLMDFGLAEPDYRDSAAASRIMGTPRYMAPEQRAGGAVGPEADYFSFACLAYEMLSGTPVFTSSALAELNRSFLNWTPPSLLDVRPGLGAELDDLLRAAFHPDPAERQLDLAAVAQWS